MQTVMLGYWVILVGIVSPTGAGDCRALVGVASLARNLLGLPTEFLYRFIPWPGPRRKPGLSVPLRFRLA